MAKYERLLFRYWDDTHGMCEVVSIEIDPEDNRLVIYYVTPKDVVMHSTDYERVMQCSGETDENGRLIFEGDYLSEAKEYMHWTVNVEGTGKVLGHKYDGSKYE